MSYFFFERRKVVAKSSEQTPGDHSDLMQDRDEIHEFVLEVPKGQSISKRKLAAIRDALDDDPNLGVFFSSRTHKKTDELQTTLRERRLKALQKVSANRHARLQDAVSEL